VAEWYLVESAWGVVVCSFSHYAPVLAFLGDQPQVVLNPSVQQHAASNVGKRHVHVVWVWMWPARPRVYVGV
jgi:hypothetical protein